MCRIIILAKQLQFKTRLYSKPKDTFKKALGRVLSGLPSQLGKQILDDICDRPIKLQNCCCHKAAHALWTNQLPININQHISNMPFNSQTYLDVFDAADKAYLSSKPSTTVAAITEHGSLERLLITFLVLVIVILLSERR